VSIAIAAFLAGNSVIAGLVVNLSEMPPIVRRVFHIGLVVATAITAVLVGAPLVRRLAGKIGRESAWLEWLFVLGCAGALGVSIESMVADSGPVYFEVIAVLLVIYAAGDRLKLRSQALALEQLDRWDPLRQNCQVRASCGSFLSRLVSDVQPGDVVRAVPGQPVPIDGQVIDGSAFVRATHLTGDVHAGGVAEGDMVYAGSALIDGPLLILATTSGRGRRLDGLRNAVADAHRRRPTVHGIADDLARYFVPVVAAVAVASTLVWSLASGVNVGVLVGLSVLLVACPCGFGFATPTAVWLALQDLAGRGLRLRAGDVLERLVTIDTVAFDKTGTLTAVEPEVRDLTVADGWSRDEVLGLAAALQAASEHPIASAFVGPPASGRVERFEIVPGTGIRGSVRRGHESVEVEIGRVERMYGGDLLPKTESELPADASLYRVGIAVAGTVVAVATIGERPVDHLQAAFAELEAAGIRAHVVTGDGRQRAEALGAGYLDCNLTPEGKAAWVRNQHRQGRRVLFVGDGSNDLAALGEAHVAVAAVDANQSVSAAADATLHARDPRVLVESIVAARLVVGRLRGTLYFALAYNLVGVTAAAAGLLHPVLAAVLMMGSSLVVNLRAATVPSAAARRDPTPWARPKALAHAPR
jgi:heavy metal translocating P-type ATPase